jgi:hypothetical protein
MQCCAQIDLLHSLRMDVCDPTSMVLMVSDTNANITYVHVFGSNYQNVAVLRHAHGSLTMHPVRDPMLFTI